MLLKHLFFVVVFAVGSIAVYGILFKFLCNVAVLRVMPFSCWVLVIEFMHGLLITELFLMDYFQGLLITELFSMSYL